MRLLLVTDAYPPLIGGANRSSQLLARELVRRGHDVHVATTWQTRLKTHEAGGDGVTVHRLRGLTLRLPWFSADPYQRHAPPFPDPELVVRFRRLIKRFRPHVIHAYGWLTHSCATAMVGLDIPLVVSARDFGNVCPIRTLLRHGRLCDGPGIGKCLECAGSFYGQPKGVAAVFGVFASRPLVRAKVTRLHSVSNYMAQVMDRNLIGGRAIPIDVIPNFRDTRTTEPPDEGMLAALPAEPFALFVGAFRRVKGLEVLFAAYERLPDPPPLVLIGTRALDTPSFPDGVTVLENATYATVMAAWQRALFGVFPSTMPEGLGNVVHEAMSAGRAVIGTTPGGHADMIVDGETGFLVPAGDVDRLSAAIDRLVSDSVLRGRMEAAARMRAHAYTPDVIMPRMEALYGLALRAGGRRRRP